MTILKCQNDGKWNDKVPNCKPRTTKNLVYSFEPRKNYSMNGTILKEFPVTFATAAGECGAKCWQDVRCLLFNLIFASADHGVICQMLDIPFGEIQPHPFASFYDFYDLNFCATYLTKENALPNNSYWNFSQATVHLAKNGSMAVLECVAGCSKSDSRTAPQITCSAGFWIGDQNISMICVPVYEVLLIGSKSDFGSMTMEIYDVFQPYVNRMLDIHLTIALSAHVSGVLDDGTVVIAGGHEDGEPRSNTDFYNPTLNKFSRGPDMNERRSFFAAAVFNDQMVVCGGWNSSSANGSLASCEKLVFNGKNSEFKQFASLNIGRSGHAMAGNKDTLIVIGGFDGNNYLASIERYSGIDNKWSNAAPMTNSRYGPAAAVHSGFIYVCGGGYVNYYWIGNKCEKYNPDSNDWSDIGSMNTQKSFFNLQSVGGRLYAFSESDDKTVESYNAELDTWSNVTAPMKAHRYKSSAVLLKNVRLTLPQAGQVLLIGSESSDGRNMEIYDVKRPENNRILDRSLLSRCHGHAIGFSDDKGIVVAGGMNDFVTFTSNTQFYYPQTNQIYPGPNMNQVRHMGTAAMLDNNMIICGGWSPTDGYLATCEKLFYNSSTFNFKWESIAPMNEKRQSCTMVEFNNNLFVMGGQGKDLSLNTTEKYNAMNKSWSYIKQMNNSLKGHSAAVLNGIIYVCGGRSTTFNKKECEKYNPASDDWVTIAPMNTATAYFNLVAIDGKLYAFTDSGLKIVESYDPAFNVWTVLPDRMKARRYVSAALLLK